MRRSASQRRAYFLESPRFRFWLAALLPCRPGRPTLDKSLAGLPCQVEVASEYRYRDSVALPNTLVVAISQSGETMDTLAALEHVNSERALSRLAICNVDHSAMVRASELVYLTRAGAEIGVASTKAFNATGCAPQAHTLSRCHHAPNAVPESQVTAALEEMATTAEAVLQYDQRIQALSHHLQTNATHCSWKRYLLPHSDGRCSETQGDLLYSC